MKDPLDGTDRFPPIECRTPSPRAAALIGGVSVFALSTLSALALFAVPDDSRIATALGILIGGTLALALYVFLKIGRGA